MATAKFRRLELGPLKDMNGSSPTYPGQVPIYAPGKEPLPPGFTEEDRAAIQQTKKWEGYAGMAMESCAVKTVLAGGAGMFWSSCLPSVARG